LREIFRKPLNVRKKRNFRGRSNHNSRYLHRNTRITTINQDSSHKVNLRKRVQKADFRIPWMTAAASAFLLSWKSLHKWLWIIQSLEISFSGRQIEPGIYLAAEQGSFPGAHAEEPF